MINGQTNSHLNTVDNSMHECNFVNFENCKVYFPILQNKKDKLKERERIQRPYLADKVGKIVKGYGFIIKKYSDEYYTIINLNDLNGKYIADHIQLNFKERVYDYKDFKTDFIRFEGVVYEYKRIDDSRDYSLNLTKPVTFIEDYMVNSNYDPRILEKEIDVKNMKEYFFKTECNELQSILNKLHKRLNMITIDFGYNFIYNYILNNFMLYNATYDLYNGELQNNKISDEGLLSLLVVIASTIFRIETLEFITLEYILKIIAYTCNIVQGINSYKKMSNDFKLFYNDLRVNIDSKTIKKAWNKIILRKYNFGDNPNPTDMDKQSVALSAYVILNDYIQ